MRKDWQAGAYGACWLKGCKGTGLRNESNDYEIVLCWTHIAILEDSARGGYSQADPPPGGGWWPWREME
jgi:hypothetical protein